MRRFLICRKLYLFDEDLGAAFGFAGETLGFDVLESDAACNGRVDSEVAAHVCAWTSLLGLTNLADKHFASVDLLATKTLDAEALAGRVAVVFGRTTCFYV